MVKQFCLKAKTSLGSDVFLHLSEELEGTIHVTTTEGALYIDRKDLENTLTAMKETDNGD